MNDHIRAHIEGCREAHARLSATLDGVTDDVARRPSLLPDWTVGHVLTHIARNADSVLRRIDGARRAEVVDQYVGGLEGRAADIEAGARRPAAALVADVRATSVAVDTAWDTVPDEAWGRLTRRAVGGLSPLDSVLFSRWREVEVHHGDLGLGFGYRDWPDAYVAEELARQLARLPSRLADVGQRRQLCAWLMDRAGEPGALELPPWG
ncbi:MAG: maleylpyruvate isomerase family mycothiol-dependent enzyme [Acidimicrobiales bacterium]